MKRPAWLKIEHLWAFVMIIILVTAIILQYSVNRSLRMEVLSLQMQREEPPAPQDRAIGGVEVPIPELEDLEGWVFPIAESDYVIESTYGIRVSPILHVERQHEGVDISSVVNAQTVAAMPGVVEKHWPPEGTPVPGKPGVVYSGDPVYDGKIIILHDNGWRTLYGHLSWTRVHEGQRVRAGYVLGKTGTGGLATGDHLHFGMFTPDGKTVNPLLYVTTRQGQEEE